MEKVRKVSGVMKPYMTFVLKRDNIPFRFERNGDNYLVHTAISNRRFAEVVEDSLCEKQRDTTMSKTPVYSYRTIVNREKRARLMKLYGRNGFHVLAQDMEKFKRNIG